MKPPLTYPAKSLRFYPFMPQASYIDMAHVSAEQRLMPYSRLEALKALA